MSSKSESKALASLLYPLVGWIAVGFCTSALVAFLFFDQKVRLFFSDRLDNELETMLSEIKGWQADPIDVGLFQSEIDHHSQAKGIQNVFYRLRLPGSEIWVHSNLDPWPDFPDPQEGVGRPRKFTYSFPNQHSKAKVLETQLASGALVQVGISLAQVDSFQTKARWMTAIAMFFVALMGTAIVVFVIRRQLHSMGRVFQEASDITQFGDFTTTIPAPTGNQASDWLATTFNQVFANIHKLMVDMDQVLGDVAHDLRTPVTRLRSHAETIFSEPDISQREVELAGHAIEECDHLLVLINTILEINAAEARTTPLRHEKVDMVRLIREALDLFDSMIEDKGHTIHCLLPETCHVFGDRGYLQRILANLLDNAIKYTPENGTISLELSEKNQRVYLRVIDSGIGVAEDEKDLIFKRFYRSDKSRTLPGNGLGLTFCRAIVEAMGGQLTYEPNSGGGSVFTLKVPNGLQEQHYFHSKSGKNSHSKS